MTIEWLAAFAEVAAGDSDPAIRFWSAVTGTAPGPPRGSRGHLVPLQGADDDPYIWLQGLSDEDAPAEWHIDVYVDDLRRSTDHALDLGAAAVRHLTDLTILCSPGGLPFCLAEATRQRRRADPQRWPGGHTSLLDQVCIDVPADEFEVEARFWSDLTQWPRRRTDLAEFDRLVPPDDIPLLFLLQRLGPDDAGPTRSHVDFSTDDVAAEHQRHLALGATTVGVFDHWTTLHDPIGLYYCLTDRDPAAGAPPTAEHP